MVFIHLQKAEARVVIRHGRFAFNLAIGIDLKGQLGHAQLIALRSQHLAVGILARNRREGRQIAVISGVILQHGLTVRALYLDQGVRQIIRAGQIRLGHAHIIVNGSYWMEVVILITLDGSLDKAKIKYLENRFHHIVVETSRYIVKNGNTPPQSPVQKKIQDMLEEFILNTQLIMPALGHKVFEPQPSENNDDSTENNLFIFRDKGKNIVATGKVADDGFWVLKGSQINPKIAPSLPAGVKKSRQLFATQIDQENILQVDVSFGSPSYAASFVIGRNSNGLTEWKNKEGVSLKEMNEGTSAGKKKPPNTRGTYSKPTSSFEPVVQPANLLYLASKKVTATAYISGDQIVVVKGSQISPVERKTCRPWVRNMRDALVKEGKVVNYVFTVDTPFSSPSAAAAAILGGESNGQTLWRNENGKTLKELSTK